MSEPEEDPIKRLATLAIQVALDAPLRPSKTYSARVPWRLILEIRDMADQAGIPWRKYHPQTKKERQ